LTDQVRQNRGGRGRPHVRLRLGFLAIAIVLSVFAARLLQLQVFDPGSYAQAAAAENRVTVTLPAQRGEILDRNGKPLADSLDGEMVIADPALTQDYAPQLATLLADKLPSLDYFSTLAKLRKSGSRFQYIARQVPASEATAAVDAANAAGYPGLTTERDPIREYPQGEVAANMVGFMGTDGPLAGLELNFDKSLSGTDGKDTYEVGSGSDDARIPLGQSSETAPVNGTDLRLTIDSDLQFYVQKVLEQAVEQHHAESGIAGVVDTRNDQILALADAPTFNASDPAAAPAKDRGMRSVTDPYEPGSVEKTLTLSSALNLGYITPHTKVTVPPVIDEGGPIHDWFSHGVVQTTPSGVLAQSSNLGTIELSKKFKQGQLRSYLSSFGLGQPTDLGIPGEASGTLPSNAQWSQALQDRIDFGQSVSVTAVQMMAAVNTIANGGRYVAPSLIQGKATTDSGKVVGTDTATSHQVITKKTAHQMELMMQRVMDPTVGVGGPAQVPGYLVAGKTGTAQEVVPSCGCYGSLYTVSFMGFAPADKPAFTVYVVLKSPKDGTSGGGGAGSVFAKIMSHALSMYGIAPTKTAPSKLPAYFKDVS
jgi:cell division protein FtsI (penicillin-binding protein 3)